MRERKIGLVGPSNAQRSLPWDAQRTINLYPLLDQQGLEVSALYGTPGLVLFGTCGVGPVRGVFPSTNGRAFVVANSGLYEITSAGVNTLLGTLLTATGAVSIDENPTQMMICDGVNGYILTYSTNAFSRITDSDFPLAGSVTFIDSYFVVNKNNSGQFYISSPNDGTAWDPLDFATAESSPDNLLRVLNSVGQLWLFGSKTTEIWTDTGAVAFPFARISGAKLETGILAPLSAVAVDNTVVWAGQDAYGSGIIFRANGFTPQRISDDAVEYAISQATDKANMRAFSYQQEGHAFYFLTGGGLANSWVYDFTTQLWHERAYLSANGFFEQHLASCGMYIFGKQLVGDRTNGNIYQLSLDAYDDAGNPLVSRRVYTHISNMGDQIRYNQLRIAMEVGVGTQTGQGKNPTLALRVSTDGAKTWSYSYTTPIGSAGQYQANVTWRRLGIGQIMTFEISQSDPVKRSWIGSYLS